MNQRNKKRRWPIVLAALVFLVGVVFTVDAVKHPYQGDFYAIIGVKRERIDKIQLFVAGKNLLITDSQEVEDFLSFFDGNVRRVGTTYFKHTTAAYGVMLYTDQGNAVDLALFPTPENDQNWHAQFSIGYYQYAYAQNISEENLAQFLKNSQKE